MVVDLVIPEKCLVSIAPEEVLGADVHVRVLDALLDGLVRLVLPVLAPEAPCVDASDDQAGDDDAVDLSVCCLSSSPWKVRGRWTGGGAH